MIPLQRYLMKSKKMYVSSSQWCHSSMLSPNKAPFFPLLTYLPTLLQVYDLMLHDERYYPSFKQSPLYVRMLAELDMLKEPSYRGSDDGEGESFNGSPTGSISLVRHLPAGLARLSDRLSMWSSPAPADLSSVLEAADWKAHQLRSYPESLM